ncbi:MAG TPA: hypothetical protein VFM03_10465 [Candidatus Limnocylindria bacterium]|nr:hypothetical protein [Candidatus Limnocylindria bacterium]
MLVLVLLAALLTGGSPTSGPLPLATATVPPEDEAFVLPEAGTYQAVVVDVDGDGTRELARLMAGERGSIVASVWRWAGGGWEGAGPGVEVVPPRPTGAQGNVEYAGAPVRLLVRRIEGVDRLTLVRQPRIGEPGIDEACCLILDDLLLEDGALRLRSVAPRTDAVDAITAIDFDGDGTDELLATRSLPPAGDIAYPTDARLLRWTDGGFAATSTQLPIGSGDSPFVLGDSDGLPGEEAAIVSTLGGPGLYRISLEAGDRLRVDAAGLVATGAAAVPLGTGGGVAVVGPAFGLRVAPWPAGGPVGDPVAERPGPDLALGGFLTVDGRPALAIRLGPGATTELLALDALEPLAAEPIGPSAAAELARSGPLSPFTGWLPRGGPDDAPRLLAAGKLVPSLDGSGIVPAAAFGGMQPLGLLGPDRSWLATLTAPLRLPPMDPRGGRLDPPVVQPGSGVAIVPASSLEAPEVDDGQLIPATEGAQALDGGVLAVDTGGFAATIDAPPGSRVTVAAADPSTIGLIRVVGPSGRLAVPVAPPAATTPNPAYRAVVSVTTPSGGTYTASWGVRVFSEPPELDASVSTPLGSADVVVTGVTSRYATVRVGDQALEPDAVGRFEARVPAPPWPTGIAVTARDPVGNETTVTVTGVGFVDYRGLPWAAITLGLLGIAAVVLFLRIPRGPRRPPRRRDDDATFEEMEPD